MRKRYYNKGDFWLKSAAVILTLAILSGFCFYKMRPVITAYAVSEAKAIMLESANRAVLKVFGSGGADYGDIVSLSRDAEGRVTSLETDIVKINTLKALTAENVSALIAEREFYGLAIPIGTFFSNNYTNGLGPKINFKMQLSAYAEVDFSHDFKSAGINQVLHIITVDMKIKGSLVIAGFREGITAESSVMAAQTVILGATPEAFTQVIENETDNTAGLINDYGAVNAK